MNLQEYPLVSICIPMFNAEQYAEETFLLLQKQSYRNIEVIVVDDHSTDGSMKIALAYKSPRFKVLSNPGKGACSARNYAFRNSTGRYIKFMDADDYCSETLIEHQVKVLIETPSNISVAFSPLKMLFADGEILKPARNIDMNFDPAIDLQIAIWKFGGFNCPHCYMMHRELVEITGGWDETILKNQDGEYFARLLAKADMAISVKEDNAVWRQTRTGISSKNDLNSLSSVVDSYAKISRVILSSSCAPGIKEVCSRYIGLFVYTQYPHIKPIMPEIEALLDEIGTQLLLPDRKLLKCLSPFMGWRLATRLIHKLNL